MTETTACLAERRWEVLYTGEGLPAEPPAEHLLALFRAALNRAADQPAIHYFDASLTYAQLDAQSDAFAAALVEGGFQPGDRLGLFLQNVPQFEVAMLAAWKAGGIVVPLSPMSRAVELHKLLPDCTPAVILAQEDLAHHLVETLADLPGYAPRVLVTSARWLQTVNDERVLPAPIAANDAESLEALLERFAGRKPAGEPSLCAAIPAILVYTSGTTGAPKGAIISHGNVTANARVIPAWYGLKPGMGPVLGLAPLFHVTGLVGHISVSWSLAAPLVLTYRFHTELMLETMLRHKPCFTVGAITAYIAMMQSPLSTPDHYRSFHAVVSGGAPIPPAIVDEFRAHSGRTILNGYGLTETSAAVVAVPQDCDTPVDPASGSLSVGLPKFGVDLWIAGEAGEALPVGEVGEIVVSGPTVSCGYWSRPEETAQAMRPGGFHTGDVGFMDEAGWVYLVDRMKDMINASGYKVWPREVEDVLYSHAAVREAAVVGVPDSYRGESVRAVISLRQDAETTPAEIIAFCRARIAPYKVPREVIIMDDLPKTLSGKILRRALKP